MYKSVTGAYRLQPPALLKTLQATPHVLSLDLPHCSWLQGPELKDVAEVLPGLTRLDVSACRGVDAAPLAEALGKLSQLASLCLGAPLLLCQGAVTFEVVLHVCDASAS